jgi:hypothetical protein
VNQYGFASGDPVNFSDPFGLIGCKEQADCRSPIVEISKAWANEFAELLIRTADAITDAIDLVNPVRGFATAAGADPRAQDQRSKTIGLMSMAAAAPWGTGEKAAARLTNSQAGDLATYLGFSKVKDAPFKSHGQSVFSNGKVFITQDATMHLGPNATWKMFSGSARLGTYDALLLTKVGK